MSTREPPSIQYATQRPAAKVRLNYFSDILCVWAYIAQIRLDELKSRFSGALDIHFHFVSVFGSAERKIAEAWGEKGGYQGFSDNVQSLCSAYPHVEINKAVWKQQPPKTSANCHLFLKAVQLLETQGVITREPDNRYAGRTVLEELMWRFRLAFFKRNEDISDQHSLFNTAKTIEGLPLIQIKEYIENGAAIAALCDDIQLCSDYKIEGSPTYVLNEGRQKLYGNLGYKILEANVHEILHRPDNQASWC